MNVTDSLEFFTNERIMVGKEEGDTSAFNQAYDKLQANKENSQTNQILELAHCKVH